MRGAHTSNDGLRQGQSCVSGHPTAEGWYRDPYGVHEHRWFSSGQPTKLVRDGGVEASDDPPAEPMPHEPERVPEPESATADDLRRADDAEAGSSLGEAKMRERAGEQVTISWPTW
jgi:hypothetical protein